jgi:protein SCO1
MNRDQLQPEPRSTRPERLRLRSVPASRLGFSLLLVASSLVASAARVHAQPGGPLKEVAFDQNLNAQIPLVTPFRDEQGRAVQLSDYFGKRPVILVMGYTNCPLLCSVVLGEVTRSLKPLDFSVGKDFDIVTVSINPKETPEQADGTRRMYLGRYKREGAEAGWHALTGDEASITRLAKAVGFRYTYNPKLNIYAHAAGFVLLTPAGRISRYFYGVEFPARELKYALMEASASKIGSPIDKLVMYCYDYDPATGKYTFAIMNAIRVLGVATVLALGTYMFLMFRRDRRMARATKAMTYELPPGPAIP